MPLWWGRKNARSSDERVKKGGPGTGGRWVGDADAAAPAFSSPRRSVDFVVAVAGRGSSGFESDGLLAERRGHPLPLPVNTVVAVVDRAGGCESGSASVSSLSSSGSSEEQFGADRHHFGLNSGYGDQKFGSRPGPGSRSSTAATSPLHPRLSPGRANRLEDGASQCHPLPLPPNSPTSPPPCPNKRTRVVDESSPHSLSQWKKGKLLGRGSFGHVYVGFNSDSGHMCAIKEVKVVQDDRASKECLKQLNQEINLLSKLSHPNIVRYYGSEMSEETLSVYLEYVSGGSIHKLLQEYGAFKEPVIQNYARQIVSGLVYLHGRNTLHRDIKGANILVDPTGDVKLADFGMAKHITSASSMLSFKGSPYWMAPEVVMNASSCNFAVDIWSLGCTILEMATGKPPWSQYEGVAAIFKIGNSREMPEIPDTLSSDAKSFINLCLQRDPSRRPTALQMLGHPFIYEREANVKIPRDAFLLNNDGNHNPPALQLEYNRKSLGSYDVDFATHSAGRVPRGLRNPREHARTIMSLPVSPSSSPLRQRGSAFQNSFFTPPHPSSSGARLNGSTANNNILPYPPRPSPLFSLDPWHEATPAFTPQTPIRSPTRRPISHTRIPNSAHLPVALQPDSR
uniref:mitogen-activated protein kinase kinase kinase n=1 Tax=Kalanchoe fedtschenkoi TaxID=63787 RepID=A0A7N0RHZ0_KALFE